MKRVSIIIFDNDLEIEKYSDLVCKKLSELPEEKEFCGIWGEIKSNQNEVLSVISNTVNRFINGADKTEIVFGCCKKDYNDIVSNISIDNCLVEQLSYRDF